MVKLERYREVIQQLLQQYAEFSHSDPAVETEIICDTVRDHYQIVYVGWRGDHRVYGCILHLDIKNDKIWLQHNGTESDIGEELFEMGVPKTDITIGFHSPFKRQFTEYAVG